MSFCIRPSSSDSGCFIRNCQTPALDEMTAFFPGHQTHITLSFCPDHASNAYESFMCPGYFDQRCDKLGYILDGKCMDCEMKYQMAMRKIMRGLDY